MKTDIRPLVERILRQMVLAGLPIIGAACGSNGEKGGNPADLACLPVNVSCPPQFCPPGGVVDAASGLPLSVTTTTITGFNPNDRRWADLYRACVASDSSVSCGPECTGLCKAVLEANAAPGYASYATIDHCEITCGATNTVKAGYVTSVCGRRPNGTIAPRRHACADRMDRTLASYLCEAAELEAASVPAFARLAVDLAHHGAPRDLILAARSAMTDEARHWQRTRDLARRHGARPVRPTIAPTAVLPLEDVAIQNVVEGCVRETFGAMVAAHQSAQAEDADVRGLMREIAVDELGHAALSFRIDAWAVGRLGETFLETRRDAALTAVQELLVAVRNTPDAQFLTAAGLPARDQSHALLAAACAQIWGPAFGASIQSAGGLSPNSVCLSPKSV
ncbi:MAG: ferritin-like domain-containing protein [Deltaproteobacteria bacterium]|nr:ferritin-like domain-containing protein [Deltaproteobacteria bacterium]